MKVRAILVIALDPGEALVPGEDQLRPWTFDNALWPSPGSCSILNTLRTAGAGFDCGSSSGASVGRVKPESFAEGLRILEAGGEKSVDSLADAKRRMADAGVEYVIVRSCYREPTSLWGSPRRSDQQAPCILNARGGRTGRAQALRCWCSQARALRQSRSTDVRDMSKASAVSLFVNPPK